MDAGKIPVLNIDNLDAEKLVKLPLWMEGKSVSNHDIFVFIFYSFV